MEEKSPKSIKKIQELMEEIDKTSIRYNVLETALLFKSNWIKLGEKLHEIYKTEQFKVWGYPSFEKYCSQEIGIKKQTAEKLTTSYYFLKEHEPKVLADYTKKEIPDYNTIDFLSKVHSEKKLPEEEFDNFKKAVFDEGCSDKTLKKKYNEFLSGHHNDEEDIEAQDDLLTERELTPLIRTIEKLDRKAEELTSLPVDIKTDIRKLLAKLKSLV